MNAPQPPYPWNPDPSRSAPNTPPPPPEFTRAHSPGPGNPFHPPIPPQRPQTPVWLWVLLAAGIVAVCTMIAVIWVIPHIFGDDADTAATTTQTIVVTSTAAAPRTSTAATPNETLPAGASRCGAVFSNREFPNSATGSAVTSCEFAEEVRYQYVSQSQRRTPVTVSAVSPVTNTRYSMSCSGQTVVTCTGGNNAIVYVY